VRFPRFYVIAARLQNLTNRLQKANPNITSPDFVLPVVFSFSFGKPICVKVLSAFVPKRFGAGENAFACKM